MFSYGPALLRARLPTPGSINVRRETWSDASEPPIKPGNFGEAFGIHRIARGLCPRVEIRRCLSEAHAQPCLPSRGGRVAMKRATRSANSRLWARNNQRCSIFR